MRQAPWVEAVKNLSALDRADMLDNFFNHLEEDDEALIGLIEVLINLEQVEADDDGVLYWTGTGQEVWGQDG